MLKELIQYLMALDKPTTRLLPANEAYPSEVVTVAPGVSVQSLEPFQARPNRTKHVATVDSSASFIAYVNRFKGPETSVYLDIVSDEPSFAAVIDHHGKDVTDWRQHGATFKPRVSLEWKAWTELHNGGAVKQGELLAFFEDHLNDLLSPAPTVMLQALQKFELAEKHTYKSALNLDNGNIAVNYIKDGQPLKVEFPHTMTLAIPVLENEASIVMDGRLRYRTSEGKIAFTFQFKHDPSRLLRDTLRDLSKRIAAGTEGVTHYEGRVK